MDPLSRTAGRGGTGVAAAERDAGGVRAGIHGDRVPVHRRRCRRFEVAAETLFGALDEFALLSIPMFLLMGFGRIAASRAGTDLYEALDRWLYRVPGAC